MTMIYCSTFGVTGDKWNFSAKATVTTMLCSWGGGSAALVVCYVIYKGKIKVAYVANSVYSSLVASTGFCYLVSTREAVIIGFMRYTVHTLHQK